MYLIDSSILIDFLGNRGENPLVDIIEQGLPYALTPLVVQEVLQGIRSNAQFKKISVYLSSQIMLEPKDALGACMQAAEIFRKARTAGYKVRSSVDCLIAQIAVEHEATLVHNDRDFDALATVIPLKVLRNLP